MQAARPSLLRSRPLSLRRMFPQAPCARIQSLSFCARPLSRRIRAPSAGRSHRRSPAASFRRPACNSRSAPPSPAAPCPPSRQAIRAMRSAWRFPRRSSPCCYCTAPLHRRSRPRPCRSGRPSARPPVPSACKSPCCRCPRRSAPPQIARQDLSSAPQGSRR